MEDYDKIKKVLALGFMNFLDENRTKGKMCLSNGECTDIEKAVNEQDWSKLARYLDKYLVNSDSSKTTKDLEEAAVQAHISLEERGELSFLKIFEAGAKWHEAQMLKEAVEGTITCQNLNRYILVPGLDESLIYGDKVRVIIIPKED